MHAAFRSLIKATTVSMPRWLYTKCDNTPQPAPVLPPAITRDRRPLSNRTAHSQPLPPTAEPLTRPRDAPRRTYAEVGLGCVLGMVVMPANHHFAGEKSCRNLLYTSRATAVCRSVAMVAAMRSEPGWTGDSIHGSIRSNNSKRERRANQEVATVMGKKQ